MCGCIESRSDRGDHGHFGSGGFHAVDVSVQVLGQASAVPGLDVREYARCLCMGDHDVEGEVELLASAGQVLVVVDGCADAESADQTYASGIFPRTSLVYGGGGRWKDGTRGLKPVTLGQLNAALKGRSSTTLG
jgi:hypothetical protein